IIKRYNTLYYLFYKSTNKYILYVKGIYKGDYNIIKRYILINISPLYI
ncbi:hypothetical protein HZ326_29616, partial [Fusarium oxysporum f. sp. albedinis]